MTIVSGYSAHYREVLLLRHDFFGLPKRANAPFWLMFAVYYACSFVRWFPVHAKGAAIFEPIVTYCAMWLALPAPVCFLWMFVSSALDLIAICASVIGFDPNSGLLRGALLALECSYCIFYLFKFYRTQR